MFDTSVTITTLTPSYVSVIAGILVASGYTVQPGFSEGRSYMNNNLVTIVSFIISNIKINDGLSLVNDISSLLNKNKIYYYSLIIIYRGQSIVGIGNMDGEEDCISRAFKLKALL